MISAIFRRLLMPLAALAAYSPLKSAGADLNLVGIEMVRLLQNGHYSRIPYDAKLGQRFFDEYIEGLDPDKIYFTQPEVDRFRAELGGTIQELLVQGKALAPAGEIFALYRSRVEEQTVFINQLLAEGQFSFESDRVLVTDREELPWPTNVEVIKEEWKLFLEESLLAETIRREKIDHIAEAQAKPSPFKNGMTIQKKIELRQERFLKAIQDSNEADIANYLFSAVTRSHDPHCEYQSPREHERFRINVSNQLVGIGASLSAEDDGATKIQGIVRGGPADLQGGLKLGDRIVAVSPKNDGNFESVMFLHINKVVELILGAEGTEVGLKISEGDSADAPGHVIVIQRGKVVLKEDLTSSKIYDYKNGEKIGVITIPSFYFPYEGGGNSVSLDVRNILERFKKENVSGVVLDLTNNGGGSLDEVATMVGLFVPRGPVVQTKTTTGYIESLKSSSRVAFYKGPLVMLTTKASASATEILAAALQDYNRAVIVGSSSTYGKGTIQRPVDIGSWLPTLPFSARDKAGHVKFTTGKYYRVSGGSVQQRGVIPDIILPSMARLSDEAEFGEKFNEYALPYDVIRVAAGFKPLARENLFSTVLSARSAKRVLESQDFKYRLEDIEILKKERAKKSNTLNLEKRRAELAEFEARREARNSERRARFARMEELDQGTFQIYRMNLEDLGVAQLTPFDPKNDEDQYMRREKSEIDQLDDTPEWPSGIHPVKREGMKVLLDLIEVTKSSEANGTLQQ
ncbi:MAG: carboxy terminal-processing peptidase [Akkermansiaceae bacterium]